MHDQQSSIHVRVAERHGIARHGEPVRIGVPLARGWLRDVADVQLADELGAVVPGQIGRASCRERV